MSVSTTRLGAAEARILPHNQNAARVWGSGGARYDAISRQIASAIDHCVDRLDPRPGDAVLDVATGTGWTARQVAERGAEVTGIDLGAEVIEAARGLDATGAIDFRVGDAEELPFPDASFDAVISTFGVMFSGNPEAAARELVRVCKPGGRLALATWPKKGGVWEMFQVIRKFTPQPATPAPSPFEWGGADRLSDLLGDGFDLSFEEATCFNRDRDGAAAWEAFASGYGPVVTLLGKIDSGAAQQLQEEFTACHDRYRTGAGILVPRPYVIAVGHRRLTPPA